MRYVLTSLESILCHQHGPSKGTRLNTARLEIKVQPGASRNEIGTQKDGVLNLRVNQPPHLGRANEAAILLLSKYLGVPKSCISIVGGSKSRLKSVKINNISQAAVNERLNKL